ADGEERAQGQDGRGGPGGVRAGERPQGGRGLAPAIPSMTPEEAKAKVLEFTRRPFAAVAAVEDADGMGARLLEPASAKELRLRWDELAQVEERTSALRPAPYLILLFHDGRQVAL